MIGLAIIGCAAFVGIIIAKAHSPASDEPDDQYSDPFGDVPFVIHSDGGDWMGWVHAHPDTERSYRDHD